MFVPPGCVVSPTPAMRTGCPSQDCSGVPNLEVDTASVSCGVRRAGAYSNFSVLNPKTLNPEICTLETPNPYTR